MAENLYKDDVKRQVIRGMIENRCTQHLRLHHPKELEVILSNVKKDAAALDSAYRVQEAEVRKEERP